MKLNAKLWAPAMLLAPITAYAQTDRRPNIVCIVAEDISPYIGCYGDSVAQTPNIDRLASEGVRYTNFYTTMGVSAPSRAGLITGMYPSAIGANYMRSGGNADYLPPDVISYRVVPPAGVKCYTEYLRAEGYYCTNNAKTDYQFDAPLTAWDENGRNAHWKNAPEGKPFFAIFNIGTTHESQIWERAGKPLTVDPKDVIPPPYFPDHPIIRRDMAVMYSNINHMDGEVQEFIRQLQEAGQLDNTIILWYSDNGGPLPRQKRSLYMSGLNVPLIIRYPDSMRKGTVNEQMCSFVDIPATILSLAGIRPPEYMHGKAFAGNFEAPPRQYVYGAKDRCDREVDKVGTVKDKRYQYIRNYMPDISGYRDLRYRKSIPMMMTMLEMRDAGQLNDVQMLWFKSPRPAEEFYDLATDPHNIRNLIADPRYKPEIDRLRLAYDQWIRDYNSLWLLPERETVAIFMPDGRQQTTAEPVIVRSGSSVSIFCETHGASIAYRINGAGYNDSHWFLYVGSIELKPGDTLTAIATRAGYRQSRPVEIDACIPGH
jgi:arylsulfatase A-like enzyme